MPTLSTLINIQTPGSQPFLAYDAEYHIGIIPWDDSDAVCIANTIRLNAALEAMHYNGLFEFADGTIGPVLLPIRFSGKTFYFRPPIKTSRRIGGALFGSGGLSYEMTNVGFTGSDYGGMRTRLVGINPEGFTEPAFRIRNYGFELWGLDIYGRSIDSWSSSGPRAVAAIQIEGSAFAVTGNARIRNCLLCESQYGIHTLAGYWDDSDVWHADENHAEQTHLSQVYFSNVESCLRFENQQSVAWYVENIAVSSVGVNTPEETVVFDMMRGGCLVANGVAINFPRAVVLRLDGYSPNQSSFDINGIYWDRPSTVSTENHLVLVRHTGTGSYPWRVRMAGNICDPDMYRYDSSRFFEIDPDNELQVSDMYFDLKNLPTREFVVTPGVPWVQRDPDIGPLRNEIGDVALYYKLDSSSGSTAEDFKNVVDGALGGDTDWTTKTLTDAVYSGGNTTYTTSGSHGYAVGDKVRVYHALPVEFQGDRAITSVTSTTFVAAMSAPPYGYISSGIAKNGRVHGGLRFGSTGYVNVPANAKHNLYVNSTIAFWLFLRSYVDGSILSKVGTNARGFRTQTGGHLYINGVTSVDIGGSVSTGSWHHIAVTNDNTATNRVYVDGVQVGSTNSFLSNSSWMEEAIALRLGAPSASFLGSGTGAADMILDDVRLYLGRTLSADAIAEIVNMATF